MSNKFCVIDLETTGFSPKSSEIIEFAAVKIENFQITENFHTFIMPIKRIPFEITKLTGIDSDLVMGAPTIQQVRTTVLKFIDNCIIAEYSQRGFDINFIKFYFDVSNIEWFPMIKLMKIISPNARKYDLSSMCSKFNIPIDKKPMHHALNDTFFAANLLIKAGKMIVKEFVSENEAPQSSKILLQYLRQKGIVRKI